MIEIPWSKETFPNFTEEMWAGNAPCRKEHEHINGGYTDHWTFFKGAAETYNGEICWAEFHVNQKTIIFIDDDTVNICYIGQGFDDYNYCNKPTGRIWGTMYECYRKDLEFEKVERILNKKFPNCKIWSMIQARAKELCGVK